VYESFDPYLEWLGIQDLKRPPDHYKLLGLSPGERDPQVIAHAADVQMAKIRRIRPGSHLAEWSRLLDQINAVKVCLLNPVSKVAYDGSLPAQGVQAATPAPPPTSQVTMAVPPMWSSAPTPIAIPVPAPIDATVGAEETPFSPPEEGAWEDRPADTGGTAEEMFVSVPAGRPQPTSAAPASPGALGWIVAGALGILVLALSVTLYRVVSRRHAPVASGGPPASAADQESATSGDHPSPSTKGSQSEDRRPGVKSPQQEQGGAGPRPKPKSKPSDPDAKEQSKPESPPKGKEESDPQPQPKANGEKPQPAEDAAKRAAFKKAVSNVRFLMSDRDLAAARAQLKTAEANAQSQADQDQVARLDALLQNLTAFWNEVRKAVAGLQPGTELMGRNSQAIVVETSREELVVRSEGQVHRMSIQKLPTWLVLAVVAEIDTNAPSAKLLLGAFLAVEPGGDRARARQLWQEAARGGIDVSNLLPELNGAAAGGKPSDGHSAGVSLETMGAELEQRSQSAQGATGHRKIALDALALLQTAVASQRLDQAGRLAELALSAARKSQNPTLMKQAAAASQQVQALRGQK